jgi:tRNA modification GTPase
LVICEKVFAPKKTGLTISSADTHTIHFGTILKDQEMLDEVLVSVFRAPHSYTGEDAVEISCHGSSYIQQKIVELLISKGVRHAKPGEFTDRTEMVKLLKEIKSEIAHYVFDVRDAHSGYGGCFQCPSPTL